jgi:uncharacterized membrane protein
MENKNMKQFSINEVVKFGYNIAKKNILFFLGVFVISILISGVNSAFQNNLKEQALIAFLISFVFWVLSEILSMGILRVNLKFVGGEQPKYKDLFVFNWGAIFNYILAAILSGIIIAVGFVLVIIPGIIFAIRLQYVGYLVVDKNLGAIEAIKKSWAMTKGHSWHLFVLGLALFGINILGLIALVVGLLVTVPLSMIATATVYRKLSA